jgi:hypothetical protein
MNGPDPKPSLIKGLREFYQLHNKQVSDEQLNSMASSYAGRENDLWIELYKGEYKGRSPGPKVIQNLANKYQNPFTNPTTVGGPEEPPKAPDQQQTEELAPTPTVQTADFEPAKFPIQNFDPMQMYEDEMNSYEAAINNTFENEKKALDLRKKAGEIDDSAYSENLSKIEGRKQNELSALQTQRNEGFEPDKIYPEFDALKEKYKPYLSNLEDQAIIDDFRSLPGVNEVVADIDRIVANEMGVSVPESKRLQKMYEQGRMGKLPADAYALRKEAVEKNKDVLQKKYPHIPSSFFDTYIGGVGPLQGRKDFSDMSDPENPYHFERFSLAKSYVDINYPDADKREKQRLRRLLVNEMVNRPTIEEAKKRTEATLEKAGMQSPSELIGAYKAESKPAADKFVNAAAAYQERAKKLYEQGEATYKAADAAYIEKMKDAFEARKTQLQSAINAGMMTEEEAMAEVKKMQTEVLSGRQHIFSKHSNTLAAQQRQLIKEAEDIRAKQLSSLEEMREKYNLEMDDEGIQVARDYIDQYNAVMGQHLDDIHKEKAVAGSKAYKDLTIEEKLGNAWTLGYMDMFEGVGGGLKWLGWLEAGQFLSDRAEAMNMALPEKDFGEFGWEDLTDPDWWVSKGVRTIPLTLNLAAVGGGVMGTTGSIATAAGLNETGAMIVSSLVGGGAMRGVEGFMEAGNTYNTQIKAGKTHEKAAEDAAYVFRNNMLLALTDAVQLATIFGKVPIKKKPGKYGKIKKAGGQVASTGMNFVTEGWEEVYQEYLQQKTENPMTTFLEYALSPQAAEAFVLGGVSGAAFSLMGGPGADQVKTSAAADLINQYAEEAGGSAEAIEKRHNELVSSLQNLKQRGVITEGEYLEAIERVDYVSDMYEAAVNGELPISNTDPRFKEYIQLNRELDQYSEKEKAYKKAGRESKAKEAGRLKKKAEQRINQLLDDAEAPKYDINGVPVSEQDFDSLTGDQEFLDSNPGVDVKVQNDTPRLFKVALSTGSDEIAVQAADEFIKSSDEINTIEEAIEYVENKQKAARDARNQEETVDEYGNMLQVLQRAQMASEGMVSTSTFEEMLDNGEVQSRLSELSPEESIDYLDAVISGLESEGAPIEKIEAAKNINPDLAKKVEEQQANTAPPPSSEQVVEDMKSATRQMKVESKFAEAFPTTESPAFKRMEEQDPDLAEQIKTAFNEDAEIDPSLQQEALQYAEMQTEEPTEARSEEFEAQMEKISERKRNRVKQRKEEELKKIDTEIEKTKSALKDYLKSFSNDTLGLTPVPENVVNRMLNDVHAMRDLTKLAYLYIKRGTTSLSAFAQDLNIQVNGAVKAAWANAWIQYNNETDLVVQYESDLAGIEGYFEAFREALQDRDVKIIRLQDTLKDMGVQIDDEMDLYIRRELQVSRTSEAITRFTEKIYGRQKHKAGHKAVNEQSFYGRLRSAFPEVENIEDQIDLYMYAKHAPDFNARVYEKRSKEREAALDKLTDKLSRASGAKKQAIQDQIDEILNDNVPHLILLENGSGMTNEDAQAIVESFESQPDFSKLDAFVQEYRQTVIDARINMLEEAGIITEERAEALRSGQREGYDSVFENYVPLRVSQEAYNENNRPSLMEGGYRPAYGLKGSSQYDYLQRNSPMKQAFVDYLQAIKFIEQNRTKEALYNMIKAQPDSQFWQIVPSVAAVEVDEAGNITQSKDLVPAEVKMNAVTYIKDGKLKYLYMPPQRDLDGNAIMNPVMKALKRSTEGGNKFIKGLLNLSRLYINFKRNFTTTYNIAFGVPNFTRDIQEALSNITTDKEALDLKGVRRQMLRNLMPAFSAISRSPWDTTHGTRMGNYYFEAKENGMKMSWARYASNDQEIIDQEKMIDDFHDNKGKSGLPTTAVKAIFDRVAGFNDILENMTRLATYAALRDQGISPQKAAAVAKNISLNFEKKGTKTQNLNALYLFANAGIQGVARGGKLLFSKNGRRVLSGIVMYSFISSMLTDLLDEDDDMDVYGDFVRDNNFLIYNPWEPKEPIKIPKPYSFVRIAANLGSTMYDAVSGRATVWDSVNRMFSNLQTVVDPIGGSQENWASAYMPSVFKVQAEIYMNKKWNGSPVTFFTEDKRKPEQKTSKTWQSLVDISEWLDENTALIEDGEGIFAFSPAAMEYAIRDMFGAIGGETLNVIELYEKGYNLNKVPIARRFATDIEKKQEMYLYRLYELTTRRNMTGLTDREYKIAKEAYEIVKEKKLTTKRNRTKIRKLFFEKYGKNL